MTWVSWRLQRTETLIAAAILALLALLLVPTGIQMAGAYHHDGLAACLGQNPTDSCGRAIGSFTARFGKLGSVADWFTLVPGLVGAILAAPFVLELENGTYRLAWTQSVTRRRWIANKLGLAIGTALLFSLAMTLLVTWWRTPFVHLQGRMENSVYDSEGIVVFGYTLFALGLVLAIGVLWRRAVTALMAGLAAYVVARIFVDTWLRERLITPVTGSWPLGHAPANFNHAWLLSQTNSLTHGAAAGLGPCRSFRGNKPSLDCLGRHGAVAHAVYIPDSRFWLLQGIETSIFVGVAVLLIVGAAWWTHQRAS